MKNLTKEMFKEYEFIPVLLKYFALSPENKVTAPGFGENVFITYYQDDNGIFHKCVDLGDGGEVIDSPVQMELETLINIIRWLPELKATKEGFSFKTMEDQVKAMSTAYVCLGGL